MKPNAYLAIIPRDREAAVRIGETLCPRDMRPALVSDALLVFIADAGTASHSDGASIVVGHLFDLSNRPARCDDADFRQWREGDGAPLLERYWGSYLAFLSGTDGVTVLREPSGGIGCYYSESEMGLVVASDAALIVDTGLVEVGIDWAEIDAQLAYVSLRTERTALAPIRELLPGTALVATALEFRVETRWSPFRFVQSWSIGIGFDEAAEGLRRVLLNTVGAWTRVYPRALSELSGGLDSSIITACLGACNAAIDCVTVRGGDADLDETRYARLVADSCGFPLHRLPLDPALIRLDRSTSARQPRPTARIFGQASDLQLAALGRELDAMAFFSGGTGDTVLWYFNTAIPALDRLDREGVGGFWCTIGDLAAMCDVSRGHALAIAIRKRVQWRPQPWPHDLSYLAPGTILPEMPEHPWLPAPKNTARGVRAYVRALIQMHDHFEYYDRSEVAPVVTPFFSQPVIQYCLGVPSWLWCAQGANRAVARAAFANVLPTEILARRNKGGFDGFANMVLLERRDEACELLTGGHLAARGLLDLKAIEAELAGEHSISERSANRLLRLLSIETWLGHWMRRP